MYANHVDVEDEVKTLSFDGDSGSSLEAFAVSKGVALQSIYLSAWSLVLREFVGSDFVRFGRLVLINNASPIRMQSYSANINDWTEIRDLFRHFDLLQAENAEALQAQQSYPFNSCLIMMENNADGILNNFNLSPDHWSKEIFHAVS